ncbi:hypothetical protein ACU61A_12530 [Pseudonocardia sichuanensis]
MTNGGPFAIIDFFTARPALVAELLRVHIPDHTGHCRGCSWQQATRPTYPCGIRWYAERADETLRRR